MRGNRGQQAKDAAKRMEVFCREYVIDHNASRAAVAAGYSVRSSRMQGSRLMTRDDVRARVAELELEQTKRLDITAEKVIKELGRLAFSNMGSFVKLTTDGDLNFDFSKMTEDQSAAIHELTVDQYMDGQGGDARPVRKTRFKLSDKTRALELLGKHFKLFVDQLEVKGDDELLRRLTAGRKRAAA